MDVHRFDALTRLLTAVTRRGLLSFLATLPVLGGLLALLAPDDAEARGRRRRRKKPHKHGKGNGRHRKGKRKCVATSRAKVCAGTCGPVKNKCKKTIACGSCDCAPTCEICLTCQAGPNTPGTCVVDPLQQGETCGDPGQLCQTDGACACDGTSCSNPSPVCVEGSCATCSASAPCPEGCCAGDGTCQPGTADGVCGPIGGACAPCPVDTVCWDGACVCGDVCADGCQFTSVQDAIAGLPAGSTIRLCAGTYGAFIINKNLTLIGVGDGDDEASNTILNAGGTDRVVWNNGATATLHGLRITGGATDFIGGGGVYNTGTLTMIGCTVTGNACTTNATGGGISNSTGSTLTMTDCTVSDNTSALDGGGVANVGNLGMTDCTVVGNTTVRDGGGIKANSASTLTLTGCVIGPNNKATTGDGGGLFVVNDSAATLDGTSVTGNTAGGLGGGIATFLGGTVELKNGSTVSGNTAPGQPNCSGSVTGPGCA
jgi:hypothetical protein